MEKLLFYRNPTKFRICLDFTANKYYVILFSLFEALFTIFTLFVLANRPLFAATKQCKSAQKHLSTKLEIKSKQILNVFSYVPCFSSSPFLLCFSLARNISSHVLFSHAEYAECVHTHYLCAPQSLPGPTAVRLQFQHIETRVSLW